MSEQKKTGTKTAIEQQLDDAAAAANAVSRWLGKNTPIDALVFIEETTTPISLRANLRLKEAVWGDAVAQHLTAIGYLNRASDDSSRLIYKRAFDALWTPAVMVNAYAEAGRFPIRFIVEAPSWRTVLSVAEEFGFEGDDYLCMTAEDADELASTTEDPVVLNRLHDEFEASTRAAVAGNPHTPAATLTWMVGDDDRDVRAALAGNPSLPEEDADKLMDDACPFVRAATALRSDRIVEQLHCLSHDTDVFVRAAAARNPLTAVPDLVRLATSADDPTDAGWEAETLRHCIMDAALNLLAHQPEFAAWLLSLGDPAATELANADTDFVWKLKLAATFIS